MPDFDQPRDGASPVTALTGQTPNVPVTFADQIETDTDTPGGNNDAQSVLTYHDALRARELSALPTATDFALGDIIDVDGKTYILVSAPGNNEFSGIVGGTGHSVRGTTDYRAGSIPIYGHFRSNPDNAIAGLIAYTADGIQLLIDKTAYETAKGSAVTNSDQITVLISVAINNVSGSDTITLTHTGQGDYAVDGVDYLRFQGGNAGQNTTRLWQANDGDTWAMRVFEGTTTTTPLLVHDDALRHWVLYHYEDETRLDAEVADNTEAISKLAVHEGDGIDVSANNRISIKPPPYIGGFWGNGKEGEPDVEVLRYRDLIVDDERNTNSVDIQWSNGWTIRGLHVPINGIGMLDGQSETLSPAPGSTPQGTPPTGQGSWSFTGGSTGHLVWNGNWPEGGMDLQIAIDMSDFQVGDRIHLTLDTNNNNLWGSARTPDRGQDFHGAGDSLHHTHTHVYELRPTTMTNGTTIEIHVEAIKAGNRGSRAPTGLLRAAYVTLRYPPANLTVPTQLYALGNPSSQTDVPTVSPSWILPPAVSGTDNQTANDLKIEDNALVLTEGNKNNILAELISQNNNATDWTLEIWTSIPGILDWEMRRSYDLPTREHSSTSPAYHLYFDLGPQIDGQIWAFIARGLTGSPTHITMGRPLLTLNTNYDARFPRESVLAHGLLTVEPIQASGGGTAVESTASSGQRTWAKPVTNVERWEEVHIVYEQSANVFRSWTFDLASWRFLPANAFMETGDESGHDFQRRADGTLRYTPPGSVKIVQAYLEVER